MTALLCIALLRPPAAAQLDSQVQSEEPVTAQRQRDCDAGEASAWHLLGLDYDKEDPARAAPLHQKACDAGDAGDADACYFLGLSYAGGAERG